MFTSGYVIELFTRYSLLQDWSCCEELRSAIHMTSFKHYIPSGLRLWPAEKGWQNYHHSIVWVLGPLISSSLPGSTCTHAWSVCVRVEVYAQEKGEAVFFSHFRPEQVEVCSIWEIWGKVNIQTQAIEENIILLNTRNRCFSFCLSSPKRKIRTSDCCKL